MKVKGIDAIDTVKVVEYGRIMKKGKRTKKSNRRSESWFGEYAHRWPPDALSMGYAMACVEIVAKYSDKASVIYQEIIDTWGKPGIQASYNEIFSLFPSSEKEDLKRNPSRCLIVTRCDL